jgi:hypothetical protein
MIHSNIRFLTLFVLIVFVPLAARAQVEGNPENWCRNGLYTNDAAGFRLGAVTGAKGARVYFHGDDSDDCPAAGAKCRAKAYLIPGDEVIVSRRFGDYVCAWFSPRKGDETVGWLPAASVTLSEPDMKPALSRWVGAWGYGSLQSLDIKRGARAGGALAVKGEAYWRGLGDNIHTGEVEFEAAPQGNILALKNSEDICEVTLRLIGSYLVVNDNLQCGGANVTFNGVYRKKPAPRARR